jgi:adenosylcobinamide-GDP ribazoletransferase
MLTTRASDEPRLTTPGATEPGVVVRSWFALAAALQFLTRVPPLVRRPFTAAEMGQSVACFPLVGLLLGGLLAGLDWLLNLAFPPLVVSALVLAVWVLATGAIHLDGFLDTCDGLFGGRTADERLRIMRDEHVGAFAVIGGMLLILMKFSALAATPLRLPALLVAPICGRWAMSLAIVAFPYARDEGLGRTMKDNTGWRQAAVTTLIAFGAVTLIGGWVGLLAWFAAGCAAGVGARLVLTRLPGLTGDVYGALCETVETLVLLLFTLGAGAWQ